MNNTKVRANDHIAAREVHRILAEMAWKQLPDGCGLEIHLMTMANILADPDQYRELWRRVREGQCPA